RRFAGAGQADADIGGPGFTGAIDDAAHERKGHGFDAFVLLLPLGHLVAHVALNSFGELLERGASGAATAGTRGYAGQKGAEAERLKQFASGVDFFTAIAADARGERDANGIANAFVQENAHGGGRPDGALHAHTGLGEAEMQG